jgi:hypothetical protein
MRRLLSPGSLEWFPDHLRRLIEPALVIQRLGETDGDKCEEPPLAHSLKGLLPRSQIGELLRWCHESERPVRAVVEADRDAGEPASIRLPPPFSWAWPDSKMVSTTCDQGGRGTRGVTGD